MIRAIRLILPVLLLCMVFAGSGCILEKKVLEIILANETCVEFIENHVSATYTNDEVVDYAEEIEQILLDNGFAREDLNDAFMVSASYGVTEFSQAHDWVISGAITVARVDIVDGPVPILNYSSQSVQDALGLKIPADLNQPGVELINRALDDFLAGGYPVLIFSVNNGSVVPTPTEQDPIIFNWEACFKIHVLVDREVEIPQFF